MERSGCPINSIKAVDPLTFLIGAFSLPLPLPKVEILDWVAKEGIPLYGLASGRDPLRVFVPRLFLEGWVSESAWFCNNVFQSGLLRSWYV
jgi:hypothetical protein